MFRQSRPLQRMKRLCSPGICGSWDCGGAVGLGFAAGLAIHQYISSFRYRAQSHRSSIKMLLASVPVGEILDPTARLDPHEPTKYLPSTVRKERSRWV